MKAETLRELSTEELNKKVVELKEELFNLRFQMATGQLVKQVRKDIARAKTVIREREIAAQA